MVFMDQQATVPCDDVAEVLGSDDTLASPSADCSQPLSSTFVEDSNWEPDGVTHHVRFCEGPGVTDGWLRSCGTVGKPGGNREDKHQPVPLGEPGLLTKSWPNCSVIEFFE